VSAATDGIESPELGSVDLKPRESFVKGFGAAAAQLRTRAKRGETEEWKQGGSEVEGSEGEEEWDGVAPVTRHRLPAASRLPPPQDGMCQIDGPRREAIREDSKCDPSDPSDAVLGARGATHTTADVLGGVKALGEANTQGERVEGTGGRQPGAARGYCRRAVDTDERAERKSDGRAAAARPPRLRRARFASKGSRR
jgi:hypothetical protein